jgi:hypothetical protein
MKTILLILSAFVLSLAAGCALQPAATYQVYIDPMFSDYEQGVIRESLQDWTDKSEGIVTFNVSIAKSWGEPTPHTIWIQNRSKSDMPGLAGECHQSPGQDDGFVYLPMDKYEGHPTEMAWFGQTVRHEVGHALGLPHDVAGTIMAPSHGTASMTVTCTDVANLAKLHSIPAGFAECK